MAKAILFNNPHSSKPLANTKPPTINQKVLFTNPAKAVAVGTPETHQAAGINKAGTVSGNTSNATKKMQQTVIAKKERIELVNTSFTGINIIITVKKMVTAHWTKIFLFTPDTVLKLFTSKLYYKFL